MNKPMPMKAPPVAPVAKDTWTWWGEGGVFNTGGGSIGIPKAGLSYWVSPNMKITVSYRFDDYFKALKVLKSARW